jgi:hypothetical protein
MNNLTKEECLVLLSTNYLGRIAYILQGVPEIIPITYYYDPDQHSLISYSSSGSKIDAMRKNNLVSFQVDEISALDTWKSVLVFGEFEELSGIDSKHLLHVFSEGVKKVILEKEKLRPKFISDFSSKIEKDSIPIIYRINIKDMKGKQRA